MRVTHLIIGAGPTGLGAANRLLELGRDSFLVLEAEGHAGGLAASFKDERGFTWDIGGHVVFSHYDYFDRLTEDLLAGEFLEHQRESWVRACGTWVPYPFQNNVRHLPPEARWECVQGLLPGRRRQDPPANFAEWFDHVFGPGIARHFMRPYNFKVWATRPENMGFSWIGERVSVVDHERVLKNLCLERDDVAWGPNNTFRFPLRGGTGEIFRRLAARLGDRVRYGESVVRIDPARKEVRTAQGLTVAYDRLLSTAPLDRLVREWLASPDPAMVEAVGGLIHNGVHVAGVGVDGPRPDTRCWMYFPGDDNPFYRVTNFHNYSPNNVARPGFQRGLMAEVSFSAEKPEDPATVMDRTIRGLSNVTLLEPGAEDRVVSRWTYTADYGYPVPTLGRDRALAAVQPRLEALGISSRGRFGGWKYEVSNMDHSLMQGVEWAERMVLSRPETTYTWT